MSEFFGPLYKRDTKGKIRVWKMELEGDRYRTIAGLEDGQQVTSEWTRAEAKNVGRANATTAEEQARTEVESNVTVKLAQGGYHRDIANVDKDKFFKPMLAKPYEEGKISFPCWSQPKLDGMRCIAKADGLWSRGGKPIVSVPHVWEALAPLFEQDPDLIVDGELYNHDLKHDFSKIMSLCKKAKPKSEDLAENREKVQYWIYDVPSVPGEYNERYKSILSICEQADFLVATPTFRVEHQTALDEFFEQDLADGFEGQIVRLSGYDYENKRSKGLIKRKTFEDAEFTIVEIQEGNGNRTGMAGRVIFKKTDGTPFNADPHDSDPYTCKAAMIGNHEYCREVLTEANEYIGGQVTVDFFGYSKDGGKPRFPRAKHLYKGKRDC